MCIFRSHNITFLIITLWCAGSASSFENKMAVNSAKAAGESKQTQSEEYFNLKMFIPGEVAK